MIWFTQDRCIYHKPNSNLIKVLTLAAWISYNFFTASLICLLFAVSPTINTRVLLSSIFFIADSVVKGNLMISYDFDVSPVFIDAGKTLGFLANLRVLGLKKWTFVWTRVALRPLPFFSDAAIFFALFPAKKLIIEVDFYQYWHLVSYQLQNDEEDPSDEIEKLKSYLRLQPFWWSSDVLIFSREIL